ncbi:MAG TPA: hypothetical protein VHM20_05005 [Gammaproteobacteria bacterium]|jgi:hypothetical protein|nr:hypothetical protein [Gammaproteobacteria bacterium]
MWYFLKTFSYYFYSFCQKIFSDSEDEDNELETIEPPFPELIPAEIIGTGFLYILNILPVVPIFFNNTPKKILVLDVDNTLLHLAKSTCPEVKEPALLFEDQFRLILKVAKLANVLVVLGTARYFYSQYQCSSAQLITEIIKKLEGENPGLISAIIYTNNSSKKYLLKWLAKYYNLKPDRICLVDDNAFHRNEVEQVGFPAVNILGEKPFEKIVRFLDARMRLEIVEPTTPVVQDRYSLFRKPKRLGFAGLRTFGKTFS